MLLSQLTPRALAFSVKYRDNNEKKEPALRKLEEEKEMQAIWEFILPASLCDFCATDEEKHGQ